MEYPIWQLTTLGGGFWVAAVATLHVYVAHFAVGGGLFLAMTEHAAYKTGNPHMLAYAKQHTRFFLLLTMAFGAVSGVAIWVTISLVSPQATSTLIHQFVFAWAAEWVCFMAEIVALIIYFYTWDTMNRRDHLRIGWLYFIFGWLSLFLINGIIGFMLTPGQWLETGSFWHGFFNPSFWPSLVFRTFLAAACAGFFGFVTATLIKDEATRHQMVRACSAWTILGVLATMASGYWYVMALPPGQLETVLAKSHRVTEFMDWFWILGGLSILGGLALAMRVPRAMTFPLAIVVLIIGQGLFGAFEFMREAARKPYVIWDHIYSTSMLKENVPDIARQGAIASAKWAPPELKDGITEANVAKAGAFLYQLQCASCHSIGGPMNDIRKRTHMYDANGMDAFLTGMGTMNPYMPPFVGTPQERTVLANYIARDLNGREDVIMPVIPEPAPVAPASFDPEAAEYALFAWAGQGMSFYAQTDRFILKPPSAVIRAQLVLRDDFPETVVDGVTVEYAVEPGFEGDGLTGVLEPYGDDGRFEGRLGVEPYQNGSFTPLPVVELTARNADGEVLAKTKLTAAVSDQMGCRSCHGGDWRRDGSGLAEATGENILAVHDRMNRTDHLERSKKGPILCVECHDDPSQNAEGGADVPSLSAAVHGAHAVYMAGRDAEGSCLMCHPRNTLRGLHDDMALACTDCHGYIEDHALSVLKADQERGVEAADKLIALIAPRSVETRDAVEPRTPWLEQPSCLACHEDFGDAMTDNAFNQWTDDPSALYTVRRGDLDAINCGACHGSPHAIYPATERDNVQPRQYLNEVRPIGADGSCTACHADEMDFPAHHPGMGLDW